jgi:hypothetical protein
MYDTMNICNFKVEMDRLVGMGFVRCFIMGGLKMRLYLLRNALIGLLGIFCVECVMYKKDAAPWNRYCGSMSDMKRKSYCIVRKGEKQIQILDGY